MFLKINELLRRKNNFPDFFIVGAQKAGSTALCEYLALHPDIAPPKIKEPHYFNLEENYKKGVQYYQSLLPPRTANKLIFDASPGFLVNKKAAKRIFRHNPDAKILIILREPASRAYSAWNMYQPRFRKERDWFFKEWVNKGQKILRREDNRIFDFLTYVEDEIELEKKDASAFMEAPVLVHGKYAEQIKLFLKYFPAKNIFITESSEFLKNTAQCLKKIERFLGISSINWDDHNLTPVFTGNYAEGIGLEAKTLLKEYYSEKNEALFNLLGKRYNW
jgi:hypothetical protein